MTGRSRTMLIAAALAVATWSGALAQTEPTTPTPSLDPASAPKVDLTDAQRHTIYQSVSSVEKNHAAPIGFRPAVGATVPIGIDLAPMPDTLATLMPHAENFSVAMIEKQVVLVDPKTRTVAAVITAAGP